VKEKKKPNPRRKWVVLIGFLLLVPCICLMVLASQLFRAYQSGREYMATHNYIETVDPSLLITRDIGCFNNSVLPKDNAEVEQSGHIEFPPSATGIIARSIVGF
jgi:hypothetical protein